MQQINERNAKTWSRLGQRGTACGIALPELLAERDNCYVITADLASLSGLERVKRNYPEKFINVGIAEQNMIGVAAGLAFEGNTVFATTYATFISMRSYEQIRHNLGYQKSNVKIIGSASGLAMGMSGNTHYSYEDIAIMRVIPNMTVVSPADASEAYLAVHQAAHHEGPVYLRLSGNLNEPVLYHEPYDFQFGKAVIMKKGQGLVIFATGGMVSEVMGASEKLNEKGIYPTVINMHTIKPLDVEILRKYSSEKAVITVEEHNVIGGLGSAVAEFLVSLKNHPFQLRIGIEDQFLHPGDYAYLKQVNGLDASGICKKVEKFLEKIE